MPIINLITSVTKGQIEWEENGREKKEENGRGKEKKWERKGREGDEKKDQLHFSFLFTSSILSLEKTFI